jgi:myo-inositol-1(or 4)-monophosphatase
VELALMAYGAIITAMPDPPLVAMLELAKRLAVEAAGIALPHMGRTSARLKADQSLVTEVDGHIQGHILSAIGQTFPDHAIIAEEKQTDPDARPAPTDARFCWVIDPLDGTRNYAWSFPCYSTSIAVLDRGRPVVGVVYGHHMRMLYAATMGGGATVNDVPVRMVGDLPGSELLIGVPSSKDKLTAAVVCRWVESRGFVCRNLGSTALHLGILAAGGLSAVFCKRCKIWDLAAGVLMVREAGGRVVHLQGSKVVHQDAPYELDSFDLSQDPGADVPFLATTADAFERVMGSIEDLVERH